jgi:hypothetical protein
LKVEDMLRGKDFPGLWSLVLGMDHSESSVSSQFILYDVHSREKTALEFSMSSEFSVDSSTDSSKPLKLALIKTA